MQKPSLGRIVHILVPPQTNNGSDVAAAIITRVWSDTMINVRVLPDGSGNDWKTSIQLCEDEAAAREAKAANEYATPAFWPPRV